MYLYNNVHTQKRQSDFIVPRDRNTQDSEVPKKCQIVKKHFFQASQSINTQDIHGTEKPV